MTEDLNSALSKLILVARTKNGRELVFLESHALERERRRVIRPPAGKASCTPLPQHLRNSMECAAWGVSRPAT